MYVLMHQNGAMYGMYYVLSRKDLVKIMGTIAFSTSASSTASSTALQLASAVFHLTRPLALCVAPLRSHDHDEICN